MVRTSYLRVYQPIASFPEADQKRWLAQAGEAEKISARTARTWLIRSALPAGAIRSEGAFVRTIDDQTFVCPWHTRLRMLVGLLAFRGSVPDEIAEAFVPEAEARKAAAELAELNDASPQVRSYMLHANWHVPIRWFTAFDGAERVLIEDGDGLRIRYETSLDRARERLRSALGVLDDALVDDSIAGAVRELSEWIEDFEGPGLLELDYGNVGGIFDHEQLVDDQSAIDVWSCLEALEQGDAVRAGRIFGTLSDRWTAIRAREVMN